MKVKELIKILKKHDPELNAAVTWEGVNVIIDKSNIYPGADIHGGVMTPFLFLDGDQNFYKEHYQKQLKELKK